MRHKRKVLLAAGALVVGASSLFSAGDELRDLNVSDWPCLNEPSGTAKTSDGIERNLQKNRNAVAIPPNIESLDTAGFLNKIRAYDGELHARRRTELTQPNKDKLKGYENKIVSLTGYVGVAYAGPPETCNCADRTFHDWHLEIFATPIDHPPRPGDPYTPLICEITPRTEREIFRDRIRLDDLAGFIRTGKEYVSTNHPPQLIKVTGYLMFDDEHNGRADTGDKVEYVTPGNGFHHPWRATAWEIHPILTIESVNNQPKAASPPQQPVTSPPSATTAQEFVTVVQPVRIQIPYGQAVLPTGMRLPVVRRHANTIEVRYMEAVYSIPVSATQ